MFESISAWIMPCLTSLFSLFSFIFVIITCKNIVVISHLLKLSFIGLLIKLFFLVSIRIDTCSAHLLPLWSLSMWECSLIKWLLFHLIISVKVCRRLMISISWNLTHNHILSHYRLRLIMRIMLVVLLLRLSVLLWSVIRNLTLYLIWVLILELRDFTSILTSWGHAYNCRYLSFVSWRPALLSLPLVIITFSININTLWWFRKIEIGAMRIFVICSSSSWFSTTELRIATIKLFSHRFVYCLCNCTLFHFSWIILTH